MINGKYLEGSGLTLTNVLSRKFPEGTGRNLENFRQYILCPGRDFN
jgi:hypothetical protein